MVPLIKPYLQMACETFSFADELFCILDCGHTYIFLEGLSKIGSITCMRVRRKTQVQPLDQPRLENYFYKEVFYTLKEVPEYGLKGLFLVKL